MRERERSPQKTGTALRLAGGDYLFLVKGNQPQLLEDLRVLFAPPAFAKRAGEGVLRLPEQQAQTTEKAHGRLDIRSIRVSSELKGYSDWPGLEQVFEIRRCWQSKGVWKEAVRYGVTSLPALLAIPERVRHRCNEDIGPLKTAYIPSKM